MDGYLVVANNDWLRLSCALASPKPKVLATPKLRFGFTETKGFGYAEAALSPL
ncbi:MAG: hypothetical protein IKZ87_09445 [Actinomycetaceae bacterium]|nr:hypothetical protein [Actinomycetaceae bacterium]